MHRPDIDLSIFVRDIALHDSEQAYNQLFNRLFNPLKRFAASFVKSNELAEEIAGDVMITLWRNRRQLLDIRNIKVYAFVIAKNTALNALKIKTGDMVYLDETNVDISFDYLTPEQILINEELKNSIQQIVQALPPRCKMVFKLVKEDNLSYKEVAEILDISPKTVDAHLVTAIKKISGLIRYEYNLI
jgi:RNA polymerase sigma-70 factor (ECF subfamily)